MAFVAPASANNTRSVNQTLTESASTSEVFFVGSIRLIFSVILEFMWQKIIHKYLKIPYTLNTREFQSPKNPTSTIVLLHGIGSSLDMWTPHIKKLPKDARIIGIDLLGFGKSPKPTWGAYSAKLQATSVSATLLKLRALGDIILVGHSLGSLVSIELASRYPLMASSLILISPPIYAPNKSASRFDLNPKIVLRKMHDIMRDNPNATERILRMAGKYYLINPGFKASNVNVNSFLTSLEAAILNQQSYKDILRIKHPTRIISGKLDVLVINDVIKNIVQQKPSITWKSVIGGHEVTGSVLRASIKAIRSAVNEIAHH